MSFVLFLLGIIEPAWETVHVDTSPLSLLEGGGGGSIVYGASDSLPTLWKKENPSDDIVCCVLNALLDCKAKEIWSHFHKLFRILSEPSFLQMTLRGFDSYFILRKLWSKIFYLVFNGKSQDMAFHCKFKIFYV